MWPHLEDSLCTNLKTSRWDHARLLNFSGIYPYKKNMRRPQKNRGNKDVELKKGRKRPIIEKWLVDLFSDLMEALLVLPICQAWLYLQAETERRREIAETTCWLHILYKILLLCLLDCPHLIVLEHNMRVHTGPEASVYQWHLPSSTRIDVRVGIPERIQQQCKNRSRERSYTPTYQGTPRLAGIPQDQDYQGISVWLLASRTNGGGVAILPVLHTIHFNANVLQQT